MESKKLKRVVVGTRKYGANLDHKSVVVLAKKNKGINIS
jgi:hypothetical protein